MTNLEVDGDLDDVNAHVNDVTTGRAIISGAGVTLQSVCEIATVQEVVAQVIVTSPDAFLRTKPLSLNLRMKS